MDTETTDLDWRRRVVLHGGLIGLVWGSAGFAGSTLVLAQAPGVSDATVMIATSIVAFTVGIWVGAADARKHELPIRDRWLAAAAVTAVAGAFGTFSALYRQFYLEAPWHLAGLVLAVALPAYALGRLPPLLVVWGQELMEEFAPEDEGEFPMAAPGAVTMGLLAGVVVGILLAGLVVLPAWSASSLLMIAAFALLLPLAFSSPSVASSNEMLIHESATPIGTWRVTEVTYPGERQPERRLYLNEEEESGELVRSGAPTLAYVAAAEQWLTGSTPQGADYLFLGGGACTLPRRIAERDGNAHITVVELDPEVIRIARRFFGLRQHHHLRTIFGDARAFLESDAPGLFDRIYVDVYGGREVLPYTLVTREAATTMARRLKPDGWVAMNVIGTTGGDSAPQVWAIVRTFEDVFGSVALYTHLGRDYPEKQNLLLAASPSADVRFPEAAGLFDIWPQEHWPDTESDAVLRDVIVGSESRPGASTHEPRRAPQPASHLGGGDGD